MTPQDLKRLVRLPDRTAGPPAVVSREIRPRDGWVVEHLRLDLGGPRPVRGLLSRPLHVGAPLPAVLYCHAHGARYEIGASELLDGRPSLLSPYGPLLAARGYVTLAVDMPTFGERADEKEDALAKALLWHGRTLMGEMLADHLGAFAYLASRPDVDAGRIAAFGLSMGATHAYFLGAIEPRIARVAHLCCLADLGMLVETGAHDLHGHYMTIPGLLEHTSFGRIAGMVAPRPQLVCMGERDPLTPTAAFRRACDEAAAAYAAAGVPERLSLVVEPEGGHAETPRMRDAILAFLDAMA